MRRFTGRFFSMDVPASFHEMAAPINDGDELVALDAPSSKPDTLVRVVVGGDTKPKDTALERSKENGRVKQSEGVKDLTSSTVSWPGAQSAILLQWTEKYAGPGAAGAPQRNWQLSVQVNDHLVVQVLACAPAGEFDRAGLAKIVETFRPHD